jgi:hypothetical protein
VRRLVVPAGFGIALVVVGSFTTVFSTGSEVVTAVAIAAFVAASLVATRRRSTASRAPKPADGGRTGLPSTALSPGRGVLIWVAAAGVAIAFELSNYFRSPRYAHPTVSYFLSSAAGHQWSRGILFAAWLTLGSYLVSR